MSYEKDREYDGKVCADAVCGCMVSVSCITFNHGRYIRQALDSFLSQETDFDFEILIHDDASTDDTADIIKEYAEKYPNIIRPMFEEKNQYSKGISNISGVFNFPRARGRYIAMCEGDDFWTDRKKLQKQADIMEAHPELALCTHAASVVSDDEAFRSENVIRPFEKTGEITPEAFISKKTNIPTASMFFRTEYAKELPEWYYSCPVGDIPLQLFMTEKGGIWYIDETMSAYRTGNAGSWGEMMDDASEKAAYIKKWEAHFDAMKRLYDAFDLETCGKWHEAVETAVNRQRFHIDLKEGNAGVMLKAENRQFAEELPRAERRLQLIKAKAPAVYELMRKLYGMLN